MTDSQQNNKNEPFIYDLYLADFQASGQIPCIIERIIKRAIGQAKISLYFKKESTNNNVM